MSHGGGGSRSAGSNRGRESNVNGDGGSCCAGKSTLETWTEAGAGRSKNQGMTLIPFSSEHTEPPPRPKYGEMGRLCEVRSNHFHLQLLSNSHDLYHYEVSITETASSTSKEIRSEKLCKRIMSELTSLYRQFDLGNRIPAYDGKRSFYTAGQLPFQSNQFIVRLIDDEHSEQRREKEYRVSIKETNRIDSHHLLGLSDGRAIDIPQAAIQTAVDVVMRAAAPTKYVPVGRSLFSASLERGQIGSGLEYWKGYYQSVRPVEMGLSLNVDASARPFYKPICLTDFVSVFLHRRRLSEPLTDQDMLMLKRVLRGIIVKTTYMSYTKCYKIKGLSTGSAKQEMFDTGTGKTSVYEYFLTKYRIKLQYPFLPCIKAGPENRISLIPMELCKLVEAQYYKKKLNKEQVAKILKATCQRPHEREQSIIKMVKDNRYKENQLVAKEFGVQLSEEPTLIKARILPVPMLNYSDDAIVVPDLGQWKMYDKNFYSGATVRFWTCLNFSPVNPEKVKKFCTDVVNMCVSKGMNFNPRPIVPIRNASSEQIERALREVHTDSEKQLQLLLIILPTTERAYETIKRICETELGIISQCCNLSVEIKRQYLENLSFKINVKTGGTNVALHAAIQRRIPVVASMDWPGVTKYRALISAQGVREEIIQDLYIEGTHPQKGMIKELLLDFYNSNGGKKPSRIIFYRNGVSECHFAQVLLEEVQAIRKACQSLQDGYAPRLTFIIVQKRHHTRLFPVDRNMTDRSGNILPGTVVDTTICHPIQYDFYLCSHAGIQGTSRPTNYHVLFDENYFPPDLLQLLTYSLCYTYARCTRSVSVVPPVYYAHLAALRGRVYMKGEASDNGSTSRGFQRSLTA